MRSRRAWGLLALVLVVGTALPAAAEAPAAQAVAPGVAHRELRRDTAAGPIVADVLDVDLADARVGLGVLAGWTLTAPLPVSDLANRAGAVAAVNGDLYDRGRTEAPVGPMVSFGAPLKSADPWGPGRDPDANAHADPDAPAGDPVAQGTATLGARTDDVVAVGPDGRARLDRLALRGAAVGPEGRRVPVTGLNVGAVADGEVVAYTAPWGLASRRWAACGEGDDCADDPVVEVAVEGGVVREVRDRPGDGPVPAGGFTLVGRGTGVDALRSRLRVGDPVTLAAPLVAESGGQVRTALGAVPVLRGGAPVPGLDDAVRDPRTAVGIADGGRRLVLVTVDGRSDASVGLTLAELAGLLAELGATDGAHLDGGGSSTLVARRPGALGVTVENAPSDGHERPVPQALGVFALPG